MRTNTTSFVFAVFWLLLITTLLCIPGAKLPSVKWHNKIFLDKWVHVGLFLVLVFLWCRVYIIRTKKTFFIITIISIVYGVIMELIQQYFIPFRSFDYADMIANSIGCIAGYLISVKKFLPHR